MIMIDKIVIKSVLESCTLLRLDLINGFFGTVVFLINLSDFEQKRAHCLNSALTSHRGAHAHVHRF